MFGRNGSSIPKSYFLRRLAEDPRKERSGGELWGGLAEMLGEVEIGLLLSMCQKLLARAVLQFPIWEAAYMDGSEQRQEGQLCVLAWWVSMVALERYRLFMEIGFIIINNRGWKAAMILLVNEHQSIIIFSSARRMQAIVKLLLLLILRIPHISIYCFEVLYAILGVASIMQPIRVCLLSRRYLCLHFKTFFCWIPWEACWWYQT
jgi:hypothetical protein